ncbi:MAG: ABC transporter substrate-binding protein [Alicyclobacillaceae bacterium]|nr:ABC transporter substrate-binding protein [Alicyclobacillaceae bacterium]
MSKKRWMTGMGLALAAVLAVSGCGSGSGGASGSQSVKVGVAFPVSGPYAKIGQACTNGTEIAADIVNDAHVGPKIELVKVDVPDATAGVNEVNRLISQQKVKVFVGTYVSPISMAVSDVTERNKAVLWEVAATEPRLTNRGYQYVFRPNPNAAMYGPAAIDFLSLVVAPKLGMKADQIKLALVHEDGDYGQAVAKSTKEAAQKAGIPVVADISYNAKTTNDMSSIILQIKQSGADVLDVVQYDADAQLFWKQAKQLGLNVKAVIGNGAGQSSDNWGKTFGKDGDGVFDVSSAMVVNNNALLPETQKIDEEFHKRYKEKFGKEPDLIAKLAFSSAYVLFKEVIPKAGGDDPVKIRAAALSLDLPQGYCPTGWGIKFDQSGQNTRATLAVMQWQQGKLVVVFPEKFQVSQPVMIPLPKWSER